MPQIHQNCNIDDYYAGKLSDGPALSQSCAKTLLEQSPKHAWMNHPRLNPDWRPDESRRGQAVGSAAHKLMIGRGADIQVIEAEDYRTKAAQAIRDQAQSEGKIAILLPDWAKAQLMVDAAAVQLDAMGLKPSTGYSGEVAITWTAEGCELQTLIDMLHESNRIVIDYKTTAASANPVDIPRYAVSLGWDIQAAFHKSALDAVDPEGAGRRRHLFILQENYPPFALTPVEMPESWLCMGTKKLWRACEIWRECIASGEWPAYPAKILIPEYPAFAEERWLKRELAEEVA